MKCVEISSYFIKFESITCLTSIKKEKIRVKNNKTNKEEDIDSYSFCIFFDGSKVEFTYPKEDDALKSWNKVRNEIKII